MKLVSSVIRAERLDVVKEALNRLNLVGGLTVTSVRGSGRQKGLSDYHKGIPYAIRFKEKIRLDIVVPAADASRVVTLISELAYTGEVGDGKIFVVDVLEAMRIRTGETGVHAL